MLRRDDAEGESARKKEEEQMKKEIYGCGGGGHVGGWRDGGRWREQKETSSMNSWRKKKKGEGNTGADFKGQQKTAFIDY